MTITIVALMCQALSGTPLCHEEIVTHVDSIQACMLFPADLAQWKMAGRFADDSWRIAKVRCVPGNYEKMDAT